MGMDVKVKSFKVEVIGFKNNACHKALEECAEIAESNAKLRCPVDTGNLRRSYTHIADSSHMVVGTDVEYGKYQELGTSRNRPQPHLAPAFKNNVKLFEATLSRELSGGTKEWTQK